MMKTSQVRSIFDKKTDSKQLFFMNESIVLKPGLARRVDPGSSRSGPGTGPGLSKNSSGSWPGETQSTRRVNPEPGRPR